MFVLQRFSLRPFIHTEFYINLTNEDCPVSCKIGQPKKEGPLSLPEQPQKTKKFFINATSGMRNFWYDGRR